MESVVPKGVTGEDSAAFMKVYVDRWVRKQLKLKEAETLFSASGDDIDKMVEEYRQALLIRKLNQLYVDRSIDTRLRPITMRTRPISGWTVHWSRGGSCSSAKAIVRPGS